MHPTSSLSNVCFVTLLSPPLPAAASGRPGRAFGHSRTVTLRCHRVRRNPYTSPSPPHRPHAFRSRSRPDPRHSGHVFGMTTRFRLVTANRREASLAPFADARYPRSETEAAATGLAWRQVDLAARGLQAGHLPAIEASAETEHARSRRHLGFPSHRRNPSRSRPRLHGPMPPSPEAAATGPAERQGRSCRPQRPGWR